jgi:hypothetical protein
VLGVLARCIEEHDKLTHQLLAVRGFQASHADENQAQVISGVNRGSKKKLRFYVGYTWP